MRLFSLAAVLVLSLLSGTATSQQAYYEAPYRSQGYGRDSSHSDVSSALQARWDGFVNKYPTYAHCGWSPVYYPVPDSANRVAAVILGAPCSGTLPVTAIKRYYSMEKSLGAPCSSLGCEGFFGNPINAQNGNKFQTEADFTVSRLLDFTRYYNSDSSASTHLLGQRWTNTYTRRIEYLVDRTTGPIAANVSRPDGKNIKFKNVLGQWLPDADITYKLVRQDDAGGVHIGWTLTDSTSDSVEEYDAKGRLLSISSLSGESVVLIYNNGIIQNNKNDYLPTLITNEKGLSLKLAYDTSLRLSKITLPDDTGYSYVYDTSSRLIKAIFPGGTFKQYHYGETINTSGANLPFQLTGITDEKSQRYATFKYDVYGKGISTEHAGGVEKSQVVYVANATTDATITDALGRIETRSFASMNGVRKVSAISETVAGITRTKTFTYDANGRRNISKDFADTTNDTDYNTRGLLTQQIESANKAATKRTTQTDWHASFNVPTERRVLNANNVLEARSTYAYNNRGQITAACQIDPSNSTAMAYVCGSAVDAPVGVRQSTATYCEQADVTAGTCPTVGLTISSNGSRTDVSDISTFTYYPADDATCAAAPTTCPHRKGDLWKVSNALSQVSEVLSYDGIGRLLKVRDANNVVIDMEYNARGRLTARKVRGNDNAVETDDVITRMEYDATGQVVKVTQADGEFMTFVYDAAHRLTTISDAHNNSITYTLDNAGNRTAETTKDSSESIKRSLSRVYDIVGRLQASKNAASTTVATLTYDANDNLNTSTDGLNRVADQDVDPLNRLIKTIQDKGAGTINATTAFEYDARDNLTKVIDPKNLNTVYSYDGLNDLTQLSSPDTGATTYTYDSAGNRKTQTDAKSNTTTYRYDALNRLTQVGYATASLNSNFVYDTVNAICDASESFSKGRLTRFIDTSGDTQYCYDRFGNLTRKQVTNDGIVSTLLFTYTKAGRISSITYPSGMVVNYSYNTIGQTSQVTVTQGTTTTTLVDNISYLPFGPLKSLSFPVQAGGSATSPLTQTRTYDNNYAVQSIGGLNYDVDLLGNITSIVDGIGGNTFEYDNLDRLNKVKDSTTQAEVTTFTYDATGNRLSKTIGAAPADTYSYPATNHHLTQAGANSRTLDANGNTTQSASDKYFTYDERNRMVDFRTGSATSTIVSQYQYNAKGERVRKYKGTVDQVRYHYGEGGQLLVQNRLAGGVTTTQEIIWLGDMPIGVSQNGTLHGILTDHLNSPRGVFELATQKTVWRWNMADDAFGENIAMEDPDLNGVQFKFDMRFPGQLFDVESGLHYNYFRDYEAATGRYVESDPIGLAGGSSTYGYASQNPINSIDIYGLSSLHARVIILLGQGNISEAIVIANAGGLAIAPRLQQLQGTIQGLTSRYPLASNQCEKVAKGIFDALKANKVKPQYLRLAPTNTPYMHVGNSRYTAPQHFAVRIGDRVFDASTGPNGMLYSDYIGLLNRLNGGSNAYVVQTLESMDKFL